VPLFAKKQPADDTSRQYLASAPSGPRTKALASACLLHVADLPVSSAGMFGSPITDDELRPAVEVVIQLMRQDRELSAFVARETWFIVRWGLEDFMDPSESMDTLLAAAGIRGADNGNFALADSHQLPPEAADHATSYANGSLAVLGALMFGPEASGYQVYVGLFTGSLSGDSVFAAYCVVAWAAIAFGRLLNTNRVRPGLPALVPAYRTIPAMESAGWYPNPPNSEGIVNGDARVQRFWDGMDWTDQVRIRSGGAWKSLSDSLHDAPPPENPS
jgi:hypothetical protein